MSSTAPLEPQVVLPKKPPTSGMQAMTKTAPVRKPPAPKI